MKEKSEIVLFLGSGASASFGTPVTEKFKKLLLENQSEGFDDIEKQLFKILLSFPAFQDIEYVLDCLKDLKKLKNSNGGKFLSHNGIYFHTPTHQAPLQKFMNSIDSMYEYISNKICDYYYITIDELNKINKIYSPIFNSLLNETNHLHNFTTNYDLAIEKFCESSGYPNYNDGFVYDNKKRHLIYNIESFN